MIYQTYQASTDFLAPLRVLADGMATAMRQSPMGGAGMIQVMAAASEMFSRFELSHHRPDFAIRGVTVDQKEYAVEEEAALVTPFATLLRFRKNGGPEQPRVLVVAPLSGHFATLLRNTVETLLPEHDVYITDWHNARDVPLEAGRFGLDEYTEHVIRFLEAMGPGSHIVAVCQPCVSALAAAALMAEDNNPAQPRSMTLMAGPIDCRVNPTKVNELATSKSIGWFERNLIDTVPGRFAGAGRRVYPGFVQLSSFMAMNMDRHMKAHLQMFEHLVTGDDEKSEASKKFYDEYFAVLDLAAEFYLETVQRVFQEYDLPRGELKWRGHTVNPRAIRRTALLTVEGEKDDICSLGQTLAAQDLCNGLRPFLKKHHMQAGVGHYGVFSGRRWQNQIYPIVKNVILASS
ncbi:MAG: polyhydroxyalkanoate depolymerase [Burkholderiales bacterium]|nr:polyhydroxyalkanoate depolymerase [Burkholderiales bacterium]